jgi:hypothetical protein
LLITAEGRYQEVCLGAILEIGWLVYSRARTKSRTCTEAMALTTRNRVEARLTDEGPLAASVGRPEVEPQLAVAAADSTTTTCRSILKLLPGNVMTKLLRTPGRYQIQNDGLGR